MTIDPSIKRPALRYHGSKFRLAPWIVSFFPDHTMYVEPCGGGGGVMLRKERSKLEIYNDVDSDVVNLFRVLRDPTTRNRLALALTLTPFSHEEYHDCFAPEEEPVERARRLVARSFFGFASHSHNIANVTNGFRTARTEDNKRVKSYTAEWIGVPEALLAVAERFQSVTIEALDIFTLIPKYDGPDTLFYVDPPYVRETRDDRSKGYAHEFTEHDHRKLAFILHACKAKIVLSGYPGRLYNELFADWHCETKTTMANGQNGGSLRTEALWLNFRKP